MSNILGLFARSAEKLEWGIGRIQAVEDEGVLLQFFVSPGEPFQEIRVSRDSLRRVILEKEQRVYFRESPTSGWQAGRLYERGLHNAAHVRGQYPDAPAEGSVYLIRFPGAVDRALTPDQVEVRWGMPIASPIGFLAAKANDGPFFYKHRRHLLSAALDQRAAYRGMTALASASVDQYAHQIAVVKRVLLDPVPRYILADEVGLGKTIEAGIIIRQHLLDSDLGATVLVVVPEHLVGQWKSELSARISIKAELGDRVHVIAPAALEEAVQDLEESPTMLVVDEAHQLCSLAFSSLPADKLSFRKLSQLAGSAESVLLLSATPVLRNEQGFLAMLHLLDPDIYDITDAAAFAQRIQNRQPIADLLRVLGLHPPAMFIEQALARASDALAADQVALEMIDGLREHMESAADDERRRAAIEKLHLHLQETHRLHRRLIRTRRSNPLVADDLPTRSHVEHLYRDSPREASSELVEHWRVEVLIQDLPELRLAKADRLLCDMVSALLEHPHRLTEVIKGRLTDLEGGDDPFFSGEATALRTHITELAESNDEWVDKIREIVATASGEGCKSVVFLSDPGAAAELTERLGWDAVHLTGAAKPPALNAFQNDSDTEVLVVDRGGEEGLNLQKVRAQIIHADLPLSPTRFEQRIGRLDRLDSSGANVVSHVLIPNEQYARGWARCLIDHVGVFQKSSSSLQYLLEEGCRLLDKELPGEGAEAFDLLSAALTEVDGALNIEAERERIESQDQLDAWEGDEAEIVRYSEALEDYEYGEAVDGFRESFINWSGQCLQLTPEWEGSPQMSPVRFIYRRTLMSKSDFLSRFGRSLDRKRGGRDYATFPVHFDRFKAVRTGVPLARLGNPVIEAFIADLRRDDRGVAYAFWRIDASHGRNEAPSVYFRFDFRIQAAVDSDNSALRRRADEVFPPELRTLWLDQDLEPVPESALEVLSPDYDKKKGDVSISGSDTWSCALSEFDGDWDAFCERAYRRGMSLLRSTPDLQDRKVAALSQVEQNRARSQAIRLSRMARLDIAAAPAQHDDDRISDLLHEAISTGEFLLDSVGAVFLSSKRLPVEASHEGESH